MLRIEQINQKMPHLMRTTTIKTQLERYDNGKGLKRMLLGDPDCIKHLRSFFNSLPKDNKDSKSEDRPMTELELFRLGLILNEETPEKGHLSETVFTALRNTLGLWPLEILHQLCESKAESSGNFALALKVARHQDTIKKLLKESSGILAFVLKQATRHPDTIQKLLNSLAEKKLLTRNYARIILGSTGIGWHRLSTKGVADAIELIEKFGVLITEDNFNKICHADLAHLMEGLFQLKYNRWLDAYKPECVTLMLNSPSAIAPKIAEALSISTKVDENPGIIRSALTAMQNNPEERGSIADVIIQLGTHGVRTVSGYTDKWLLTEERISLVVKNKNHTTAIHDLIESLWGMRTIHDGCHKKEVLPNDENIDFILNNGQYANFISVIIRECAKSPFYPVLNQNIFNQLRQICSKQEAIDDKKDGKIRTLSAKEQLEAVANCTALLRAGGILTSHTLSLVCSHSQRAGNISIALLFLQKIALFSPEIVDRICQKPWFLNNLIQLSNAFDGREALLQKNSATIREYIEFLHFPTLLQKNFAASGRSDQEGFDATIKQLEQFRWQTLCKGLDCQSSVIYRFFGSNNGAPHHRLGDIKPLHAVKEFLLGRDSKLTPCASVLGLHASSSSSKAASPQLNRNG